MSQKSRIHAYLAQGKSLTPMQEEFNSRRFNGRNATLRERFEAQYIPVTETGCWLWTGNFSRMKRKRVNIRGKRVMSYYLQGAR